MLEDGRELDYQLAKPRKYLRTYVSAMQVEEREAVEANTVLKKEMIGPEIFDRKMHLTSQDTSCV